jgi:hypothetical protein
MSALTDPNNIKLEDIAKTGDATEDPKWRDLLGLDEETKPSE